VIVIKSDHATLAQVGVSATHAPEPAGPKAFLSPAAPPRSAWGLGRTHGRRLPANRANALKPLRCDASCALAVIRCLELWEAPPIANSDGVGDGALSPTAD
jgi:hypothetical protein